MRVLVGNLQAAGVGINLTAATHVVFNDLDWVPGNHWQAEDRIYRIGQTRPAFVTYLFAEGTLDDFVAALLEAKARAIGVLEAEAADHACLVEEVVEAAVRGERPRSPACARDPARPRPSVRSGCWRTRSTCWPAPVEDWAASTAQTSSVSGPEQEQAGQVNTVTVAHGVARCTAPDSSIAATARTRNRSQADWRGRRTARRNGSSPRVGVTIDAAGEAAAWRVGRRTWRYPRPWRR